MNELGDRGKPLTIVEYLQKTEDNYCLGSLASPERDIEDKDLSK